MKSVCLINFFFFLVKPILRWWCVDMRTPPPPKKREKNKTKNQTKTNFDISLEQCHLELHVLVYYLFFFSLSIHLVCVRTTGHICFRHLNFWESSALSAGVVEYADYISAERYECPVYDLKLYLILRLQFWNFWECGYSFIAITPGPLWSGLVVLIRVPTMSQIELFNFKTSPSVISCPWERA